MVRPALKALVLAAPPLASLLLFAAVEVSLRGRARLIEPLEFLVRDPHQSHNFSDDRDVGIFEGDPLLFWRLRPNLEDTIWDFTLVSTNPRGLRHPRPVASRPRPDKRIICLGDSVTFGYRVPVVWAEQPGTYDREARPYPELLERRLSEANPGLNIEVLPLAVPGYSSHQGRLWLEREIAALEPDLVTACFGWNDVSLRGASDREAMAAGWPRPMLRALAIRSQTVMRLSLWSHSRLSVEAPPGRATERVSAGEFVGNHMVMARLARGAGASFLAIGTVYRDAVTFPEEARRIAGHRRELREALSEAQIPYLEVEGLTEDAYPATNPLFGETIHPNAAGHAVLSDALLASLAKRPKLLPGVAIPESDWLSALLPEPPSRGR